MYSVDRLVQELGKTCAALGIKIVTAESCTGGLIAGTLTDVPGASAWLDRGFVTYSNEAKKAMLGVREETLTEFGAVSKETAEEMALGAVAHSGRRRSARHGDRRSRGRNGREARGYRVFRVRRKRDRISSVHDRREAL